MTGIVPRTLFGRLLLVFLAYGAIMSVALIAVMQGTHQLYHREADQIVNRQLAQTYFDANFLMGEEPLTGDTLHRGLARLASANPDVDIYLIDARGAIVAASVPEANWRRRAISLEPLQRMLKRGDLPILGDDPRDVARREIFSAARVSILKCPARYLYIVLRQNERSVGATRLRAEYALGEGGGVLLLASFLAVTLSIVVVRQLTRRLSRLDQAMTQFESRHMIAVADGSSPEPDGDEIGRLTAVFQRLAARVEEQVKALQSTDNMRREVLANVSHDLRTPLSTLRTHLEALSLQGSELSAADRREYEAVAMRQTIRLSRLVEQLIEAAKLDAAQIAIHAESFALQDLVQDVVQKFDLSAKERGIKISLDVPLEPPWVYADIGLMERVLDNLLENALRYSPLGGRVDLALTVEGDRVRLAVTDTGPGLTPEQATRVFDRFYRLDPSRSTDTGHAGLGLAIVKSILELHGTTIEVDSRPGQGARFHFSLPVAHNVQRDAPHLKAASA